jgi:hypothetical protein
VTIDPDEAAEARERAVLARRLRDAFSFVPRPAGRVTNSCGPFADDVQAALGGKAADEITVADAHQVRTDLALLIRMVLVGETFVDGLDEFLYYTLTPPQGPDEAREFARRFAGLDSAQARALADYIRWYGEEESHLDDLDLVLAYWRDRGA